MNILNQTLIAAAFVLAVPGAQAADITVNGKPIKQSLIDYVLKDATARGQKVDDNVRSAVTNKMISSELVIQEAQKQGLDKQPDYLAKEELLRRELMVNMFIENFIKKNPVSDAETKAAYEEFKKQVGDK